MVGSGSGKPWLIDVDFVGSTCACQFLSGHILCVNYFTYTRYWLGWFSKSLPASLHGAWLFYVDTVWVPVTPGLRCFGRDVDVFWMWMLFGFFLWYVILTHLWCIPRSFLWGRGGFASTLAIRNDATLLIFVSTLAFNGNATLLIFACDYTSEGMPRYWSLLLSTLAIRSDATLLIFASTLATRSDPTPWLFVSTLYLPPEMMDTMLLIFTFTLAIRSDATPLIFASNIDARLQGEIKAESLKSTRRLSALFPSSWILVSGFKWFLYLILKRKTENDEISQACHVLQSPCIGLSRCSRNCPWSPFWMSPSVTGCGTRWEGLRQKNGFKSPIRAGSLVNMGYKMILSYIKL